MDAAYDEDCYGPGNPRSRDCPVGRGMREEGCAMSVSRSASTVHQGALRAMAEDAIVGDAGVRSGVWDFEPIRLGS